MCVSSFALAAQALLRLRCARQEAGAEEAEAQEGESLDVPPLTLTFDLPYTFTNHILLLVVTLFLLLSLSLLLGFFGGASKQA